MSLALGYPCVNSQGRIDALSLALCNEGMESVDEIRHRNLLALIGRYPAQRAFADAIGRAPAQVSQWVTRATHSATGKPRGVSGEMCRYIEKRLELGRGWMDNDHSAPMVPRGLRPDQMALLDGWERLTPDARAMFQAAVDAACKPKPDKTRRHRA